MTVPLTSRPSKAKAEVVEFPSRSPFAVAVKPVVAAAEYEYEKYWGPRMSNLRHAQPVVVSPASQSLGPDTNFAAFGTADGTGEAALAHNACDPLAELPGAR